MSKLLEIVAGAASAAMAPAMAFSAFEMALEQRQVGINNYVADQLKGGKRYSFSEVSEMLARSGMVPSPIAPLQAVFYLGFGLGGRQPQYDKNCLEISPVLQNGIKFRIRELRYNEPQPAP